MANDRAGEDLRVRVLGDLAVDGRSTHDLGSRKARTFLAALACAAGRPVATDVVVELLWRDERPARPADQVSVLASRLRRVLGSDRIVRTDSGYALHADWIDAAELQVRTDEAVARLAAGSASAARLAASSALELVRGPLAANEDGEWFDEQRVPLERVIVRARAVLADAAMSSGDHATAVAAAEAALDHDPYDEAALRALMRAHVALGRPASALAAYATARARLAEDLGVDPSADTEQVHTEILRGGEQREVSPASGRAIVGRDRELAALGSLFDRAVAGETIGVVVEGDPGIGKTTLVDAFASRVEAAAAVLLGRCDVHGRDLPLQPLLDGVEQRLLALGDDALRVLGADVEVIGPLVGRSAPPDQDAVVTTMRDVEAGKAVLFRALLGVVERVGGQRPVVIVVEDLHLAGASTIEWLHHALRRGRRLLVIATRRPEHGPTLQPAARLTLGPLDLASAAVLVGDERAARIHARSQGNPLFMVELAAAADDELPESVRHLVGARVESLGETVAPTLRAAAVLGPIVDLDLLADVLHRPVEELLDHLEAAADARILIDAGASMRFAHELVREALVATTTRARQAHVHRAAARALDGRAASDPLDVAWHAGRGGDIELAASALVRAARAAAARFDLVEAERLLTDAIELADTADARRERAWARMATWDLASARTDAERAIELGGGVPALELAGWVAYYDRRHDDARRLAEEGIARATDTALRASCLALAGRLSHTQGALADAGELLEEAVATAPAEVRSVATIWLGGLLVHRGDVERALEHAERGILVTERINHPFAPAHALFVTAHALAVQGRAADALATVTRLESAVAHGGVQEQRFGPVARNVRGWILRNLGQLEAAAEQNEVGAALPADQPVFAEPRYVGHLDLVDGALMAGDLDAAGSRLASISDIRTWNGSMSWHQRQRYDLARARIALGSDDAASAIDIAEDVVADAVSRGTRRYEVLAGLVLARARHAAGLDVTADIDRLLTELPSVAGLEAWWLTMEVAHEVGSDRWVSESRTLVGRLAALAPEQAQDLLRFARDRSARLARRHP